MAFLDKLGKTLASTSKDMTQKAKDFTEVTRLNMQISQKRDDVLQMFQQIGKRCYEMAQEGNNLFPEEVERTVAMVAEMEEPINRRRKLKGLKTCPHCGGEIPENTAFCPACGEKMEQLQQTTSAKTGSTICPNCGMEVSRDSAFCSSCGTKIEVLQPTPSENQPEQAVCCSCGNVLTNEDVFCPVCGTKNK